MPRWSRDGRALYFSTPARDLMRVDIREDGSALRHGPAERVLERPYPNGIRDYDVSGDASQFFMIELVVTRETPDVILSCSTGYRTSVSARRASDVHRTSRMRRTTIGESSVCSPVVAAMSLM